MREVYENFDISTSFTAVSLKHGTCAYIWSSDLTFHGHCMQKGPIAVQIVIQKVLELSGWNIVQRSVSTMQTRLSVLFATLGRIDALT